MIEPKEKALKLVNHYYSLLNPNFPSIDVLFEDCKKCALISVEEALDNDYLYTELFIYYVEVKREIQKL